MKINKAVAGAVKVEVVKIGVAHDRNGLEQMMRLGVIIGRVSLVILMVVGSRVV
jgi:hypothetical protein